MSALGLDPANLTGAFPSADAEAWRQIVDKALKGADFDRALTTRTRDGIVIRPLYPQTAEGQARPARAQPGPWTLAQRVDHPDAGAAADLAIADLQGGASGLVLVSPGGIGARGFGATPDDLETRLGGVMPDMIRIRLDAGHETPPLAEALSRLTRARGTDGGAVAVDFAYDPVAAHARHGDHEPDRAGFGAALARLAACGFAGTLVSGDGRIVHDARRHHHPGAGLCHRRPGGGPARR